MSVLLIWIVNALYVGQAALCAWRGEWPQFVILLGYAIGNTGLIWNLMR